MPKVDNWEEWDELEDKVHEQNVREKVSHKTKTHNKKEWEKIDERLQKNNNVKYVKNKRRKSRKDNNHRIS
jgi:hypothetical protein|tara:strand:+ start:984 stop:1196 length:213 start_codon:yes stop_codon:yes gene_type:complete